MPNPDSPEGASKTGRLRRLLFLALALSAALFASSGGGPPPAALANAGSDSQNAGSAATGGGFWNQEAPQRVIVELSSPSLAEAYHLRDTIDPDVTYFGAFSPELQAYTIHLRNEVEAFQQSLPRDLPLRRPLADLTEAESLLALDLLKNAVVLELTEELTPSQLQTLASLPQVKYVHPDMPVYAQLYSGSGLIRAEPARGLSPSGSGSAGKGVLIASVDGGLHKDAGMLAGGTFEYPAWMPSAGLGIERGNNGKIVVSRTYFRDWDPPVPSDNFPWPGSGTSHGVHTGAIAAGVIVTDAAWNDMPLASLSGVSPGSWLGSYRVLYESKQGSQTFFTAEGVLALQDVVTDGADVMIGAWGIGPSTSSAPQNFLDSALVNTSRAGVFVVMAAGNYGPLPFSVSNPSDEYMTAGAVSTAGFLRSGSLRISQGDPDSDVVQVEFASSEIGPAFPGSVESSYPLTSGQMLEAANSHGCRSWDQAALAGVMLLVQRGQCTFAEKIAHAAQAGASAVAVYNHAAGGDRLLEMISGPASFRADIPALFIGHSSGILLEDLAGDRTEPPQAHVSTVPRQVGNQPFVVADFSGRGPTPSGGLKPDLVAPGVNILSQGYGKADLDSARHGGYGQESGTSMSAPFVAGAAALIMEQHPNWTGEMISSALMSTARYKGLYNSDGSAAQPTDIGAGLVDIESALEPGAFLSPPKISFGRVRGPSGIQPQRMEVFNDLEHSVTFEFAVEGIASSGPFPLEAFVVSPPTLTLEPRTKGEVTVDLDLTKAPLGTGFVQGYLTLRGGLKDLHAPVFAWLDYLDESADVLLLDTDLSPLRPDTAPWYLRTMQRAGISHTYWNASEQELKVPRYIAGSNPPSAILLFTGERPRPDSDRRQVPLPFTPEDAALLETYLANGGGLLVMGQEAASFLGATLQSVLLGSGRTGSLPPAESTAGPLTAGSVSTAPEELRTVRLDLGPRAAGSVTVDLKQATEEGAEPAESELQAVATFDSASSDDTLSYEVKIGAPHGYKVDRLWFSTDAGQFESDTVEVLPTGFQIPVYGTWRWEGRLDLTPPLATAYSERKLYMAVSLRGRKGQTRLTAAVEPVPSGGGGIPNGSPPRSLLEFSGAGRTGFLRLASIQDSNAGVVGVASDLSASPAHGDNYGRTLLVSFGLEHIQESEGYDSRVTFLRQALRYLQVEESETPATDAPNSG